MGGYLRVTLPLQSVGLTRANWQELRFQCILHALPFPRALVKTGSAAVGALVTLPRSPARDGGAGEEASTVLCARKQLKF